MKPMGREKIKFPGKRNQWVGRGFRMWWEGTATPSKKRSRQKAKMIIRDEVLRLLGE